jgi:hypothetical protein
VAIPESQLETWTHIGAGPQSTATYQSIKAVIEHKDAPYASRQIDSFLQGSYGNDTNVFGADSDVLTMSLTVNGMPSRIRIGSPLMILRSALFA